MSSKRSSRKIRSGRKNQSLKTQLALVSLIEKPNESDILRQSAVKKLIALNRRHRLTMPKSTSLMVCKKCFVLYNSKNSITRIRKGQIIKTCKVCNQVRRLGGGPLNHRRWKND